MDTTTTQKNSGRFQHAHDMQGDLCWSSLTQEAGALVFVFDRKGEVVYANKAGTTLLKALAHEPVGQTLEALFGADFANEHLGIMERARNNPGQVFRLLGMINGILLSESYRDLSSERGSDAVLMVAHPAGLEGDFPDMKSDADRVSARVNHLGRLAILTERELELLHHIGMGRTSEETAGLMHRSTRTVEWHRASLGQKLGCDNRVQLARVSVRAGLTAVDASFISGLHRSAIRTRNMFM